jgi:2-polyprenyl-3-methyl-5-hydroxy-6-metoxy-1,4-benzoquinol methylase
MIGNPNLPVRWVDAPHDAYDLVILDRREASLSELRELTHGAACIGIDLAGEAREYCSFLIDALETPPGAQRPNIADSGLLHLPEHVRDDWPTEISRILFAFGGEHSGSGAELASELASRVDATVFLATRGPMTAPDGVHLLETRGDLAEQLAGFDLVVTHYGLTPYEAVWARVPVVLLNPGAYHSALSRAAGFHEVDSVGGIQQVVNKPESLARQCERIRPRGTSDIAGLINELQMPARLNAPWGGDRWQPAVQRYAERTFFRHARDGAVFMQHFRGPSVQYDHDYFFSEYARQYGRTYLEDFPGIREIGQRRIRDVLRHLKRGPDAPRVLDVGCAYGPFLQAAADAGCSVSGIDISEEAVRYVVDQLGFSARTGDVASDTAMELGGPYDIVTMWYVIEHFQELDRVLQRIANVVRPGGLFAFSTPNASGVSGRKDFREFCRRSPDDHFSLMTPKTAAALIRPFGFRARAVRVTGHHPERFDVLSSGAALQRRGVGYHIVNAWSRVARLGDTFELIAEYRP